MKTQEIKIEPQNITIEKFIKKAGKEGFCCPITSQPIIQPVWLAGNVFEGSAIREYVKKNKQNPMTRQAVTESELISLNDSDNLIFHEALIQFLKGNPKDRHMAWEMLFMLEPHKVHTEESNIATQQQFDLLLDSGISVEELCNQEKEHAIDLAILNEDHILIEGLIRAGAKISTNTQYLARYINDPIIIKTIGSCEETEFIAWLKNQSDLLRNSLISLLKKTTLSTQNINMLKGFINDDLSDDSVINIIILMGKHQLYKEIRIILEQRQNKTIILRRINLYLCSDLMKIKSVHQYHPWRPDHIGLLSTILPALKNEPDFDHSLTLILMIFKSFPYNNLPDPLIKLLAELIQLGVSITKQYASTSLLNIISSQISPDSLKKMGFQLFSTDKAIEELLGYLKNRGSLDNILDNILINKPIPFTKLYGDVSLLEVLIKRHRTDIVIDFIVNSTEEEKKFGIEQVAIHLSHEKNWSKSDIELWYTFIFNNKDSRCKNLGLILNSLIYLDETKQSKVLHTLLEDGILPEASYGENSLIERLLKIKLNIFELQTIIQSAKHDPQRINSLCEKIVTYYLRNPSEDEDYDYDYLYSVDTDETGVCEQEDVTDNDDTDINSQNDENQNTSQLIEVSSTEQLFFYLDEDYRKRQLIKIKQNFEEAKNILNMLFEETQKAPPPSLMRLATVLGLSKMTFMLFDSICHDKQKIYEAIDQIFSGFKEIHSWNPEHEDIFKKIFSQLLKQEDLQEKTLPCLTQIEWREELGKEVERCLKEIKFSDSDTFSTLPKERKEKLVLMLQAYLDKKSQKLELPILTSDSKKEEHSSLDDLNNDMQQHPGM